MASFDDDPFDQEAAKRDYKRQAKRADDDQNDTMREVYEQGKADAEPSTDTNAPTPKRSSSSSMPSPSAVVDRDRSVLGGASLGDVVIGMIGYALINAWLVGGSAGVRQWIGAKFANRVPAAGAVPASAAIPVPPSAGNGGGGGGGGSW
jgi:hypothetical protein